MSEDKTPQTNSIIIESSQISEEALQGLIESFILREGTDYGLIEVSHSTKVQQLRKQIHEKSVHVVFDFVSNSANLVTDRELKKMPGVSLSE